MKTSWKQNKHKIHTNHNDVDVEHSEQFEKIANTRQPRNTTKPTQIEQVKTWKT